MHPFLSSKNTFGEALLALAATIGGFVLFRSGAIESWNDVWLIVGFLGVVIIFYFGVLLARAIFLFMTAGDSFWWEKYEADQRRRVVGKK